MSCFAQHRHDDDTVGTPLCARCYDYRAAVLQNAHTPELWRRTSIYLPRQLAAHLGISQAECRRRYRISYVRVAEFQRRGAIHLHVIACLDAADGGPPDIGADALVAASLAAGRTVLVVADGRHLAWGPQLDVSILDRGDTRAARVAGYVAKYATKSSSATGGLDRRIRSLDDLDRPIPSHERELARCAWRLDAHPHLSHLHLRRHEHVLGYGGHFLTKSRRFSTTFRHLRSARTAWREAHRSRLPTEPEGAIYESTWRAVGIGWANPGEAAFAEQSRDAAAHAR